MKFPLLPETYQAIRLLYKSTKDKRIANYLRNHFEYIKLHL
jgi:hypothetical protein